MVHLARLAGLEHEARPGCAVPSRIRWWCSAAAASSAGIGGELARSTPRSVRIEDVDSRPRRCAAPACAQLLERLGQALLAARGAEEDRAASPTLRPRRVAAVRELGELLVGRGSGAAARAGGSRRLRPRAGCPREPRQRLERRDQLLADGSRSAGWSPARTAA